MSTAGRSVTENTATTAAQGAVATDTTAGATPRELRERLLDDAERAIGGLLDRETERWRAEAPQSLALFDGIRDLVTAGGKRLRPAFCVSGFLAAGGDPAEPVLPGLAAALELMHVSALLHDDIFDEADLRRGRPTSHLVQAERHRAAGWRGSSQRFGESVAILAGDLAAVYADQALRDARGPVLDEWSLLRSEMMVGQFMDLSIAAEYNPDPELSRRVALYKSGRYSIHRPLNIGALFAGREDLAEPFEVYGRALGEAFQLRDDLIDAFGEDSVTGKTAGLDFAQHKMTLLLGLAMQSDERVRELVRRGEGGVDRSDVAELRRLIVDAGIRDQVEKHIDELVLTAVAALDTADVSEAWRSELTVMAHRVAYRDS
ncbi:polyprenyl synthetase family protein [Streptomyces sp. NA04227]|uniref:polyprenyl synthetase family protein n=1 Tax=Streptomyces sp. NA04227 TaxID=2742136 RepID=UPI000A2099DC|nr:polyprenyl synthetase family protein [Streptomyces sp. NA04227]ARM20258.1 SauI [Streptomyces sp.]QKW07484.1 polyprenyl synthetase family protein [Streptomyces sp. NA04227]